MPPTNGAQTGQRLAEITEPAQLLVEGKDGMKCAERDGESEIDRPEKAFAHAFLATRPDPHVSVGVAARKGYWDLDRPALEGVRSFLSGLAQARRPSRRKGDGR